MFLRRPQSSRPARFCRCDAGGVDCQIKRYYGDVERAAEADAAKTLEHVISAYINNHRGVAYAPLLVYVCGPLAACVRHEPHVYYCFESVMSMLGTRRHLSTL